MAREPLSGPLRDDPTKGILPLGEGRARLETGSQVPVPGPLQGTPMTAAWQQLIMAAREFTVTWAEAIASLPGDYGFTFNCEELDAARALYAATGTTFPGGILEAHKASEGEGGCRHWPGWEESGEGDGDVIPAGPAGV